MDPLSPPTAREDRRLLGGTAVRVLGGLLAIALCLVGAGTWPRLEPLFFWGMIGVFGVWVAAGVRFKAGYARTHHADGSGPSDYDRRVARRARLLGTGALVAWTLFAGLSTLWPATTFWWLGVGSLALVATRVVFGLDEARAGRSPP